MSESIEPRKDEIAAFLDKIGFGELDEPKSPEMIQDEDEKKDELFKILLKDNKIKDPETGETRDRTYEEGAPIWKIPGTNSYFPTAVGITRIMDFFYLTEGFSRIEEVILPDITKGKKIITGHRKFKMELIVLNRQSQFVFACRGSISTMEEKYRFTYKKRKCPECKEETIREQKEEAGGGFYCWKKIGGCGRQFGPDDERITKQKTGKTENDRLYDLHSNLEQILKFRTLRGGVLFKTGMKKYFGKDMKYVYSKNHPSENGKADPQPNQQEKKYIPEDRKIERINIIFSKLLKHFGDNIEASDNWLKAKSKGKWNDFDGMRNDKVVENEMKFLENQLKKLTENE